MLRIPRTMYWADQTEVYVALDHHPSEKYVEGWKRIDSYLEENK